MEIHEIKQRLSILTVLAHYGHRPDKNHRMRCPFHPDKTPSMQVYEKTNTVYCFSSNCKTHSLSASRRSKSIDVIDFIMLSEGITKHEAILKAQSLINTQATKQEKTTTVKTGHGLSQHPKTQTEEINTQTMENKDLSTVGLPKVEILAKLFKSFQNGLGRAEKPKSYLQQRNLDYTKLETGYNSGQFHHHGKLNEKDMKACIDAGMLIPYTGKTPHAKGQSYTPFAKDCIIFPLKNKKGEIVSLYGRSILESKNSKHFYLKNRTGLYPSYPRPGTTKLIITESIIDAATLLQIPGITENYSLLTAYGTNGLKEEHIKAIKSWSSGVVTGRNQSKAEKTVAERSRSKEIIFFFDGDEAGKKAVVKTGHCVRLLADALSQQLPKVKLSAVETPENEDINSLLQGHEPEIFTHLIENRMILFSSNGPASWRKNEEKNIEHTRGPSPSAPTTQNQEQKLNTENPHNIRYKGQSADYYIKGGLRGNLDSMKVSLQIVKRETGTGLPAVAPAQADHRAKADLYEYKQIENLIKSASEQLNIPAGEIKKDLSELTHLLEQYRNKTLMEQNNKHQREPVKIPEATINQCLEILQSPNPIKRINELIGKSGVTGEENNRIFLFAIASSYKMPDTLHALIQGSSGSGKTMLLKIIYDLMPGEDNTKFTRVTDSSFYNYPEYYFVHRLVCFEDIDGLKEDALYAVRELISNEILVSSTSIKAENGHITGAEKTVRGPIASISCTTKGEIYEDNMSRVFLIAVDESKEQTKRIILYQQQKASGIIDRREEKKAKELLQNCIRLLKPYEVVNPYAGKIQLPEEAHKIRRLNDLYLSFVKQVTLINQYKRKKDSRGRLITEPGDLHIANEIMFDSIVLKVDELDGSLRGFYEKLKGYVSQKGKDYAFSQREIRQALKMSKTSCQNYINTLLEFEYISKTNVSQRNTYHYKIAYWDSLRTLRERIRSYLNKQLDQIKE